MTRYSSVRLLLAALVAFAFELTMAERVSLLGGRPELLLTFACFAALFCAHPNQGIAVAWILGLAKDLGSALPLGMHAMLFGLIAWTLVQLRQLVFREHPLMQCAIVFASVLATDLVVATFVCIFTGGIPIGVLALRTVAGALFSAALAPVVMWLLLRWRSFLKPNG